MFSMWFFRKRNPLPILQAWGWTNTTKVGWSSSNIVGNGNIQ